MPEPSLPILDCEDCGACCLHVGYPGFVKGAAGTPAEDPWVEMPEDLKAELNRFVASYLEPEPGELDGPCCWYDMNSKTCRHHQHRPNMCRDFKVGSADCLAWREVYFTV